MAAALEVSAPSAFRLALRNLGSLLLGALAVLGAILVARQGLVPLVSALFHPGDEALSVVRRVAIVVASLGGYWAYVRWHERRPATELRLRPTWLALGGASGAALIGLPLLLLFALGAYEFELYRGFSPRLLGVAALILIAAMLEELVYRALVFRVVERAWGTTLALAVQTLLFAVPHLENLTHSGPLAAATLLTTTVVLGLWWGGLFLLTRNLWVSVLNHAAWNFTILLSGVPLSGIEDWRALAPFASRYAGPDWLTGGEFGPESSWLVIAIAAIATVLLLRLAWRRGAFRPSAVADRWHAAA